MCIKQCPNLLLGILHGFLAVQNNTDVAFSMVRCPREPKCIGSVAVVEAADAGIVGQSGHEAFGAI